MGANVSNYAEYFNDSVNESITSSSSTSASALCNQNLTVTCIHGGGTFINKCQSSAEASTNVVFTAIKKLVNQVTTDQKNKKIVLGQVNVANTNIQINDGTAIAVRQFCSSSTNTDSDQKITYTAENCGNVKLYNLGQAQAQCMYNLIMKTIMDASNQATTSQSNDGISPFGIAMVIVAVVVLIVVVFVVRRLITRKGGRAGVKGGGSGSGNSTSGGGVSVQVVV
jgi:hypothetical protein